MTKLKHAKESLQEQAALRSQQRESIPLMDEYYKNLFKTIAKGNEKQAVGWAYCLTEGELCLLCDYIPLATEGVDSLISVFRGITDPNFFDQLYVAWQDQYKSEQYAVLFECMERLEGYKESFQKKHILSPEHIYSSIKNNEVIEYINNHAGMEGDGSFDGYCESLKKFGLIESKSLYIDLIQKYALVCNGREYMKMGYETVSHFMESLPAQEKVLLMQNMLRVLDNFQLRTFVNMVPMFQLIIGDKGSEMYKVVLSPLSMEIQEKYILWQNQYLITDVLGESPRAKFWMGYAGKCVLRKHRSNAVLILDFKSFSVIEFQHGEAAYFFNREYMLGHVNDGIHSCEDEESLERWLYDETEWASDKEHRDHWRKAHVGSWELDIKKYISEQFRRNE